LENSGPEKRVAERRLRRAARAFYSPRTGWTDGTTRYLRLVHALVRPETTVLDLAAGSGRGFSHGLRGRAARVVGVDLDPAVRENPDLDEAVVADARAMPFPDGSFDLVVCNYALEHFAAAAETAREIARVLTYGGALVFRAPHRGHFTAVAARLLPHRFHRAIADWARRAPRGSTDSVPTYYRLNTARALASALGRAGLVPVRIELVEAEPAYLAFNPWAFLLGVLYERAVNFIPVLAPLRANIFGVFEKPRVGGKGASAPTRTEEGA